MHALHHLAPRVAIALLAAALAACGDSSTAPTGRDQLVGTYTATSFKTTIAGTTTDQLALGASVSLTLADDGTTSGDLFIPQQPGLPNDVDESLVGTWTLDGGVVHLHIDADVVLGDIPLTPQSGGQLTGTGTFQGVLVQITLSK